MTNTYYKVSYTYCDGLLVDDCFFKSLEEAKNFAEKYKNTFNENAKSYVVKEIVEKSLFGKVVKTTAKTLKVWVE